MINSNANSSSLEEELQVADQELYAKKGVHLTDIQKMVLKGAMHNNTYEEIADQEGYSDKYLKRDVGPKLWHLLSDALGEKVSKKNFRTALERKLAVSQSKSLKRTDLTNMHQDWGKVDDIPIFYGRTQELATLEQWIVNDRCRLVALLGMRGIGKTALSIVLAKQIHPEFEYIIWRSLSHVPPVEDLLTDLIRFLTNQQEPELPKDLSTRTSQLLDLLRKHRCLIILDGAETLLCSGNSAGEYKENCKGYVQLLKDIGGISHQSCLILTSREKPKHLSLHEGENLPVRSFQLTGLKKDEAQHFFQVNGLSGSESQYKKLTNLYRGNPLLLKIISVTIQDMFDGNILNFLASKIVVTSEVRDFLDRDFKRLKKTEQEIMYWLAINRQPTSLEELKEDLIPTAQVAELAEVLESLRYRSIIEINNSLFTLQPVVLVYTTNRLINQTYEEILTGNFTLLRSHSLMKSQAKDYIRDDQILFIFEVLIDKLLKSFGSKRKLENHLCCILKTLQEQSLGQLRDTSKNITLPSQQLLEQLEENNNKLDDLFCQLLFYLSSVNLSSKLQEQVLLPSGYVSGNLINLLCQLQVDFKDYDFSNLNVWQVYLQGTDLHHVNLAGSSLAKSVFTKNFSTIVSAGFSFDGQFLTTVDINSEVHRWRVANAEHDLTFKGHSNWIHTGSCSPNGQVLAIASQDTISLLDSSTGQCLKTLYEHEGRVGTVAFSPDGQILASGSSDKTIKLWSVSTGQCLKTLHEHEGRVGTVAFSPDGQILASGSNGETIKLWSVSTGQCLKTLYEHEGRVGTVAFSPDGQILASGSNDKTIKLWSVSTGQCLKTLHEHESRVRSVAFSPDGQILASGSSDETIKLWSVSTGQCLKTLCKHAGEVNLVTFSPDGQTIASTSYDSSVKLWLVRTGQCLRTLQGYTNSVMSLAFSPDNQILASGSNDQSIRLWNTITGSFKSLYGHTRGIRSVAFSPDNQILASGSNDKTIKLWSVSTGQCLKTLYGHTDQIQIVAFSANGQTLASGSNDKTVKLWSITTGECLKSIQVTKGHPCVVTFSEDNQILASGSDQGIVKLWDVSTGECFKTLQGHISTVKSLVFSPDAQFLISGSDDQTITLWDVSTGQCLQTFQKHINSVCAIAFSGNSPILATANSNVDSDYTVKLWDIKTSRCLISLQGHVSLIRTVNFSLDGQILASSSQDGTIKLWDVKMGQCLTTLRIDKPLQGMNITDVTNLTNLPKSTLKALGAVDYSCTI